MHIVLVGKAEGKRSLGRPKREWEDNIKMDLREVVCDPGDWIALAEDGDPKTCLCRLMVVMNLRVP